MVKSIKEEHIDFLFLKALNTNVFPGASFSFSKWNGECYTSFSKVYGFAQLEPEIIKINKDFYFDLASLTKPLTTIPVLLALFEKKVITPETTLKEIFSFCPEDKAEITVWHLMSHSSGFAPHKEFFHEIVGLAETEKKSELLKRIFEEVLLTKPGQHHNYSDIGFILLGFIIEKLSGVSLAEVAESLIYTSSGLDKELFFPAYTNEIKRNYVSTESCLWRKKMLCGEVHDDNCRAMGGIAGHAGLFGTLQGVLSLCEQFLDQWKGRARHAAYSNKSLQRILEPVGDSGWTMGFDMVSKEGSSSGNYFSKRSVGHLGFTGTSFWIDPEKECIVILLTNRVHPSRDNWKIKKFRPVFHDLLMKGE